MKRKEKQLDAIDHNVLLYEREVDGETQFMTVTAGVHDKKSGNWQVWVQDPVSGIGRQTRKQNEMGAWKPIRIVRWDDIPEMVQNEVLPRLKIGPKLDAMREEIAELRSKVEDLTTLVTGLLEGDAQAPPTKAGFPCGECDFVAASKAGLTAHGRKHK